MDFKNTVDHHDQQHRLAAPARGRRTPAARSTTGRARRGHGGAARALPARVPEPRGRHRALQAAASSREIEQIVELLAGNLRTRLAERKVGLELTEAGTDLIARAGFDPVYGARPLRRFIQREVETQVARALIAGGAPEGSVVRVDAVDGVLDVSIDTSKVVPG